MALFIGTARAARLDETDLTGVTTNSAFKEYIFFVGRRIARRDSRNAVNYSFADHLGSTRVVTNSTGAACYQADLLLTAAN